jgi:hypothetical protein
VSICCPNEDINRPVRYSTRSRLRNTAYGSCRAGVKGAATGSGDGPGLVTHLIIWCSYCPGEILSTLAYHLWGSSLSGCRPQNGKVRPAIPPVWLTLERNELKEGPRASDVKTRLTSAL